MDANMTEKQRESWHWMAEWNSGRFLAILVGHFKSSLSLPAKPQQDEVPH